MTPMVQSVADELVLIVDAAGIELRTISEAAAAVKRAPNAWSIKEIVGHLIDSAANNHQRFVRAQLVDELSLPGYEQDAWVSVQDHQGRPWLELVELWALCNRHLSHIVRRIPDRALSVPCRIGSGDPVTLEFLVNDYVRHMKHHLVQIRERRA
jgi:DinB superfamily